jgi:hypothetical protein
VFAKLATADGQVVVTQAPLTAASLRLDVDAEHDLYIVETQGTAPVDAALPGEIARLRDFAFVAVPRGQSAHVQLQRHDLFASLVSQQALPVVKEAGGLALASLLGAKARRDGSAALVDIDQAFLEQKLQEFSGAVPTQVGGQTVTISERRTVNGRNLARGWLKEQYEALGFTVSMHNYGGGINSFVGGTNFVAERAGADTSRYLIVSAHLDTVNTAGADDDGAGTISALATAQALQGMPLAVNLRIVGFDEEELGLVGSKAYARYLSDSRTISGLVGVVNLEMTGYDSDNDGAFHVIDCDENTSATLSAQVRAVIARDNLGLHVSAACTNRSDHAAFWTYNKPAIVISQDFFGGDSNPCYHQRCDKVDLINFGYMQKVTTAAARAVAELVVAD